MNDDPHRTTGGFQISGNAKVEFTNSAVAAGEGSTVTFTTGDAQDLADRVLDLARRLPRETENDAFVANELIDEIQRPAPRWQRVLNWLGLAGRSITAATAFADEIDHLQRAVQQFALPS
jgi:hypothetical protein